MVGFGCLCELLTRVFQVSFEWRKEQRRPPVYFVVLCGLSLRAVRSTRVCCAGRIRFHFKIALDLYGVGHSN